MKDRSLLKDLMVCNKENPENVITDMALRLPDEFWGDVISESGINTVSSRDVDLVLNSLKAG